MTSPQLDLPADKRHARGRFGWVKRLVQGQNRGAPELRHDLGLRHGRDGLRHNGRQITQKAPEASGPESHSVASLEGSDAGSLVSDNVSTVPLKSVASHGSTTNTRSILSGDNHADNNSYVASTAETSLAPSTHVSLSPSIHTQPRAERDSESIVTLASSSRRIRRRSIDTNCSMAGIPPASIMERLTVHPVSQDD